MNSDYNINTPKKIVNTTQRHLIILIVFLVVLGVIGEFFYYRFEYSRVISMVNSEQQEHENLLKKIIGFKSSSLIAYTNDYTYWDEMVEFTRSGDTAWAHNNIDASLSTYGADYVWVYDSSKGLKYFTTFPGIPLIDADAVDVNMLMESSADKRFNHFFIEADGKIIELSIYTIHYSADHKRLSEPLGYYASGRLWSAEYIAGISELTSTNLSFLSDSSKNNRPVNENDFLIKNEYDLYDSKGKTLTRLISLKEFTKLKASHSQFLEQLMVMNLIIVVILLFSAFVLQYLVNTPLKRINKSLYTGDSKYILPLTHKKDEFGQLAKLINEFFEQKQLLLNEIKERIDAEVKMKLSEAKLKESLLEKEVLIKEVHHRVKNNLQIIISLIRLQASKVSNDDLHSHLNETLNRIKSIALVHEMLYRSDDLSHIEFKEYLNKMTESLKTIYADKTKGVNINVSSDNVYFTVDKAVPCAIIINELVTNSIKHAFKKTDSGDINISLGMHHGYYDMNISDTGSGLKDDFLLHKSSSLGMTLVDSLADQLDAEVSIDNSKGTAFNFHFPAN